VRLKFSYMLTASAPQVTHMYPLHFRRMGCYLFTVNKDYKRLKRLRKASMHQYLFIHHPQINCAWLPQLARHLSKYYYYSQANTHNSMFAAIESTRFDKQVAAIAVRIPVYSHMRAIVVASWHSSLFHWPDQ